MVLNQVYPARNLQDKLEFEGEFKHFLTIIHQIKLPYVNALMHLIVG